MTTARSPAEVAFLKALAALNSKQRRWLRKTMEMNDQPWGAATALGHSSSTIHLWLRQPRVQEARRLMIQAQCDAVGASAERLVLELSRVAVFDPAGLYDEKGNLLEPHQWPSGIRAAVQAVDIETRFEGQGEDKESYTVTKVRSHSKLQAIEMLSKLRGQLVDRHEVTGKNGGAIETRELSTFEQDRRLAFLIDRALRAKRTDSPPEASGNSTSTEHQAGD